MGPLPRLSAFVIVLVVAPLVGAMAAAIIRSSSQTALLLAVWKTDPMFFVQTGLRAIGASTGLAVVLWGGSLAAWGRADRRGVVRIVRVALIIWATALLLYPGLGSWIPVFRVLPWFIGMALLLVVVGATIVFARPSWREALLVAAAIALVFWSPVHAYPSIPSIAGRQLDRTDVLLLGFDSMSRDDLAGALDAFSPRSARKVVFDEARTTVPVTSAAWRSALSGTYPRPEHVLPGVRWPEDMDRWIPAAVEQRGYRPIFVQDSPGTNTYAPDESFVIPDDQGWKAIVQEFVWKAAFPLSSAATSWWLELAGGPAHAAGRYAFCPECFWARALGLIGGAAREGRLFAAVHSCYVHAPVHLALAEASTIDKWWTRSPVQLEGSGNPFFDDDSRGRGAILEARTRSARAVVLRLLNHLDDTGVIGNAVVVVFSDHGPRGGWIPRDRTERIALAVLVPGPGKEETISVPVSLADLAPTLRVLLGLEQAPTDGRLLPGFGGTEDLGREIPVVEPPTLEAVGVELGTVTSDMLLRDLVLNADGTFGYAATLRSRLRLGETDHGPIRDPRL